MPTWFFRKSIKTQLIVVLFALTAISITVVGFLGVRAVLTSGAKTEQTTSQSMQQRVEQFLVETTAATATKNSLIFKEMQLETSKAARFTEQLLGNPASFPSSNWRFDAKMSRQSGGQYTNSPTEQSSVFIQNFLALTPQLKKEMELTSYLDYTLPETLKNEQNAAALYYIGKQGQTRYYPNIDLGTVVPPDYNPTVDVFYTPATPENNPTKAVTWSKVYDDPAGNGLLITAASPIYAQPDVFSGIIGMDVTLNKIAKNIEDYSPIESSYAFLIDTDGRAIALPAQGYTDLLNRKPKDGEFGANLKDVDGDLGKVLRIMKSGKNGFHLVKTKNRQLYIAFAPVENTPFSLAIVADQATMMKVVADLRSEVNDFTSQVLYYQIMPIAAIILLLVWLFGFFYIRLITGPIIALTEKTHSIVQGDFGRVQVMATSAEVGKLTAAFNRMAAELAQSYQALEEKVRTRTRELNQKVEELGDAKAKDDAMLKSIGDGIIVTDGSGVVLLVNTVAEKLLSMTTASAAGKNVTDYPLLDESGEQVTADKHPMHAALKSGRKVTANLYTRRPHSKTKKAIQIIATPVMQQGKIIGAIQILRDVTKEKEVDRMKTEFISIASHQLRTPLSAIKWFSEMLTAGTAGKLKPEQQEFAESIKGSTARMSELVNSLLNTSRLESGRIIVEPKPTNLNLLVSGIIDDLRGKTEERKQEFTVTIDPTIGEIALDPRLIGQVYLNLLTNAIKYTPEGGTIELTIERKGKDIVSMVRDTGYGIPKSEHSKMFQKFFRATNIVKIEADGTGLGMYLVKAVIELAGGKIWFESAEGKGTTFWFTIPSSGMKAKVGEVTLGN